MPAPDADFTTSLQRRPDDPLGWTGRLLIPGAVVECLGEQVAARFLCTVAPLAPWHCALSSDGRGGRYVIFNKARLAKLRKAGADLEHLRVLLELDDSPYGAPMPAEFAELLAQDPSLDAYFHQLTPGKQRNLLYLITKYKTEDTRLRKAIAIGEYLVESRGVLDFRELSSWMKGR